MSTLQENKLTTYINYLRTFSVTMAAALELLGYSYRAIKERQDFFFTKLSFTNDDGSLFVVGSKAEGTSRLHDGDADVMLHYNNYICADDIGNITLHNAPKGLRLLTEMDNLNPGYSKLKFAFPDDLRNPLYTDIVSQSCYINGDGVYLSSVLFKDSFPRLEGRGIIPDGSGPALSTTSRCMGLRHDYVFAIPYKCSTLSQEWLARPRFHGWPSQKTLQQLAKLDWHLVPVGPHKDSFQEWRICFTLGEQYLVNTLNITQLHLLILLKKIMNKSLKPLCSAFSSYTAKNLVFWMVEILAPENFTVENLSSLLMMSLQMMRAAVENEQLQNYMIPSRNLLKGKMLQHEKDNIIKLLDSFIEDGPGFLTKQSEFSDLQKAMEIVNTKTGLVQIICKRNALDKYAFDLLLPLWNACMLDTERGLKMSTKYVNVCCSADFYNLDRLLIEGLRKCLEGQGLKLTEEQLQAFMHDSDRKLMKKIKLSDI